MVKSALELAKITSEDPFAGIPEPRNWAHSPAISISITPTSTRFPARAHRLRAPRRESGARFRPAHQEFRRRIFRRRHRPQSAGQLARIRRRISALLLLGGGGSHRADRNGAMQRDYWYSVARRLSKLESPEQVGKIAAQRTLRRLGARKVKTAQVPIVFDPHGRGLDPRPHLRRRKRRFGLSRRVIPRRQAGREDRRRQHQRHRRRHHARRLRHQPVRRRRHSHAATVVIENGVLKSYLLNTYTAKKLGLQTTGNASRGLAGTPGIGPGNYFLQPGTKRRRRSSPKLKKVCTSPNFWAMA